METTSQEFNVPILTIKCWSQKYNNQGGTGFFDNRINNTRPPAFKETEEKLIKEIKETRDSGLVVNLKFITKRACEIEKKRKILMFK